jgi:hypothetical protein
MKNLSLARSGEDAMYPKTRYIMLATLGIYLQLSNPSELCFLFPCR